MMKETPTKSFVGEVARILPSSKAFTCIRNDLGANCLHVKGLEVVEENSALWFLANTFPTKKSAATMSKAIIPLASAMEKHLLYFH